MTNRDPKSRNRFWAWVASEIERLILLTGGVGWSDPPEKSMDGSEVGAFNNTADPSVQVGPEIGDEALGRSEESTFFAPADDGSGTPASETSLAEGRPGSPDIVVRKALERVVRTRLASLGVLHDLKGRAAEVVNDLLLEFLKRHFPRESPGAIANAVRWRTTDEFRRYYREFYGVLDGVEDGDSMKIKFSFVSADEAWQDGEDHRAPGEVIEKPTHGDPTPFHAEIPLPDMDLEQREARHSDCQLRADTAVRHIDQLESVARGRDTNPAHYAKVLAKFRRQIFKKNGFASIAQFKKYERALEEVARLEPADLAPGDLEPDDLLAQLDWTEFDPPTEEIIAFIGRNHAKLRRKTGRGLITSNACYRYASRLRTEYDVCPTTFSRTTSSRQSEAWEQWAARQLRATIQDLLDLVRADASPVSTSGAPPPNCAHPLCLGHLATSEVRATLEERLGQLFCAAFPFLDSSGDGSDHYDYPYRFRHDELLRMIRKEAGHADGLKRLKGRLLRSIKERSVQDSALAHVRIDLLLRPRDIIEPIWAEVVSRLQEQLEPLLSEARSLRERARRAKAIGEGGAFCSDTCERAAWDFMEHLSRALAHRGSVRDAVKHAARESAWRSEFSRVLDGFVPKASHRSWRD